MRKAHWAGATVVLLLTTITPTSHAISMSNSFRNNLLAMKGVYGRADSSLSFERTHWRDNIWPYYSRVPSNGRTVCASWGSLGGFQIARYPDLVEILSTCHLRKGPVPSPAVARPNFALKCTSEGDTALVLVSLTSDLFQVTFASGSKVHGHLGMAAIQEITRLLAREEVVAVFLPRNKGSEIATTVHLRDRWRAECPECLLPPKSGIVYYETPVRVLTPIELPDSLRATAGRILLWISPDGGTRNATSTVADPLFSVVLTAIQWQRLRFKPATADGKAIGAWVELTSEPN